MRPDEDRRETLATNSKEQYRHAKESILYSPQPFRFLALTRRRLRD